MCSMLLSFFKGCLRWQGSGLARQPGHGRVNLQLPHHNVREVGRWLGKPRRKGKRMFQKHQYGYGSIPINTIFSGMNIHLPAILMWTTGVQGFDPSPYSKHLLGLAAIQSVNNLFTAVDMFFLLSSNQASEVILQKQIPWLGSEQSFWW